MLLHVQKHEWIILTYEWVDISKNIGMNFTRLKEKISVYLYIDFTVSTLLVCIPFALKSIPRVKASRFGNTK